MYLNDIIGLSKIVFMLGCASILASAILYAALLLFLPKRFAGTKISAKIGQFLLLFYFAAFVILSLLPHFSSAEDNFIPFQSIYRSLCSSSEVPKYILFFNILLFAPMGALLPWVFPELKKWYRVLGISLCVCLAREVMQLILWYRTFDIDSFLFALLGSLAGYALFLLVNLFIAAKGGASLAVNLNNNNFNKREKK